MTDRDKVEKEKIVLDTSLWIAAALNPEGAGAAAVRKALQDYTLVGSLETMKELERKLIHEPPPHMLKKEIPLETRVELLKEAQATTKIVEVTDRQERCRDPKDDMFVQLALDGGARQIVTFDKDLTVLDKVQDVQMYKAEAFLERERELDRKREVFLAQPASDPDRRKTFVELWREQQGPAGHDPEAEHRREQDLTAQRDTSRTRIWVPPSES